MTTIMDKTTYTALPLHRSERFRTPLNTEREIGLWVDRIGQAVVPPQDPVALRVLGLYAVVHTDGGRGAFYSPQAGRIALGPGDTVLLTPGEPHAYHALETWSQRWIVWGGPAAERLESLGFLDARRPVVSGDPLAAPRAFLRLAGILEREDLGAILERKTVVEQLVLDLFRAAAPRGAGDLAARMEPCIAAIRRGSEGNLDLAALARLAHLSVTHFRRLFAAYTGRSPKQFLLAERVSRAKVLLAGGVSIKETARRTGYADPLYFMRIFKKATGVPPGAFRRGQAGGQV